MSNVLLNDYCIIEYLEGNRDVICETPFPSERFDLMKMFMFECYSAMALIGRPVNRELNISTAMLHCLMSYFVTAFYTFLVSMVAVYFRRAYGYSKRKFHKLDKEIQEYLKIHTANRTLKNSVQAFFHYEFKRGYYNKKKITRDLSSEMKDELTLREACNIADKLGILGIVSVPGLLALGSCLVSEFYYSGETIYNEGEPSKSMYIVASGKLASYKKSVINGREVQLENGHQQDGDWLGEAGFLKRAPSLFTVKAILNSQLYRLDHEHLSELKTTCPKLIQQFEEIMELKEIFDKLT
ncbi:hypothetical protein AAG570_009344 [Ranatra chinensis]|uniref:Cyclic nucleotide-binding domain-containing protein n=1 Tax=Ranatra chinensis TaxID=642074 RepID=A0ABD0Z9W0_9HEMI